MYGPINLQASTEHAVKLLGSQVRLGRKQRGWTMTELAERIGVSPVTLRKVETGDPTVALGTAFEAATLVGIPLYQGTKRRHLEQRLVDAHLAALPESVRQLPTIDDNF